MTEKKKYQQIIKLSEKTIKIVRDMAKIKRTLKLKDKKAHQCIWCKKWIPIEVPGGFNMYCPVSGNKFGPQHDFNIDKI